ncbi:hypothetical protein JXA32_15595 [Candidatus Sumerlaeota bacterium]|nr:hypothetical protein [Candidatus Sumerlaeota bacterium]
MSPSITDIAEKVLEFNSRKYEQGWSFSPVVIESLFKSDRIGNDERKILTSLFLMQLADWTNQSAELLVESLLLTKHHRNILLPHANRGILERLCNVVLVSMGEQKMRENFCIHLYLKDLELYRKACEYDLEDLNFKSDDSCQSANNTWLGEFEKFKSLAMKYGYKNSSLREYNTNKSQVLYASKLLGMPKLAGYYFKGNQLVHSGYINCRLQDHGLIVLRDRGAGTAGIMTTLQEGVCFFLCHLTVIFENLLNDAGGLAELKQIDTEIYDVFLRPEREKRAAARRKKMKTKKSSGFQEAYEDDLKYWQTMTPEQRLDVFITLRRDAEFYHGV